jgi:hypothetical protein
MIRGTVKRGRKKETIKFYRHPGEYGGFMCLLNCAHGNKANAELKHACVGKTVEGRMQTRFAVEAGQELFWEYSASTDKRSEAIKCCCNAVPGQACWVVMYEPPEAPLRKAGK